MNKFNSWTGDLYLHLSFNITCYLPTLFAIILAIFVRPKCTLWPNIKYGQYSMNTYGHKLGLMGRLFEDRGKCI